MGVFIKLVSELWEGKLKAEFAQTSIKMIGKQVPSVAIVQPIKFSKEFQNSASKDS